MGGLKDISRIHFGLVWSPRIFALKILLAAMVCGMSGTAGKTRSALARYAKSLQEQQEDGQTPTKGRHSELSTTFAFVVCYIMLYCTAIYYVRSYDIMLYYILRLFPLFMACSFGCLKGVSSQFKYY